MTDIKIAFYKAHGPKATWIDKLIAGYTRGPFSHVEIILPDENGNWTMCSSSPREGHVRCKPHVFDYDSWTYVDMTISESDVDDIKEFYKDINGFRYDWAGILGFILPTQDRTDKWFCSESVSNSLKIIGFKPMWFIEPSSISPNKLYKMLRDSKR